MFMKCDPVRTIALTLILFCAAVAGYSAYTFANPNFPDRPAGHIDANRLLYVTGGILPERVLFTRSRFSVTPNLMGTVGRYQPHLAVYQFNGFGWSKIFESPGDDPQLIGDLEHTDADVVESQNWTLSYLGDGHLMRTKQQQIVLASMYGGAGCAAMTQEVLGWRNGRLEDFVELLEPCSAHARVYDNRVSVEYDAYGDHDPLCCPSIKNQHVDLIYTDYGWHQNAHALSLTLHTDPKDPPGLMEGISDVHNPSASQ